MKRMNSRRCLTHGFTLVEMMVAAAITSVIMAAVLSGSVMIQRSCLASEFHATAQNDQLRLSDYLSRDLRPATSVVIASNGAQVDLRVPPQDAPLLQANLDLPVLGNLIAPDTTQFRAIRYFLSGSDLYREENGTRTRLAQNLSSFAVARSGSLVTITTSFAPRYSRDSARVSREFTSLRQSVLVRYANQ